MKASVTDLAKRKAAADEKARRLRELMAQIDLQIERLSFQVERADGSAEKPIAPEPISAAVKTINQVLESPDMQPDYRRRCQSLLQSIERTIYEKSVNRLLDIAIERVRARDATGKNEMITLGRTHYGIAVKLGASAAFRDIVRRKIDVINNTSHAGDSAKAKKTIITAADRKAPKPEELLRRFVRFVEPPLTVVVNGAAHRTADWSLTGLLIEGYQGEEPSPKDVLKCVISVEGDDFTVTCVGSAVKYIAESRSLAIRLTENMSGLLPLMNRMRELGLKPIV